MMLGALFLGVLAGLSTAFLALLNGYSIWMALWFYSSVGAAATLVSTGMPSLLRFYFLQNRDDDRS